MVLCALLAAPGPGIAQPVVQPLPDPATGQLSDALRRLAAEPQALSALIDAGQASLELDDVDAAAGFFARAQAIAPEDGRVLTGLARVALARQQAVEALQLFDRAAARGELLDAHAAERGLAYDLVGMNTRAQVLYGQSLSRGEDAEVVRRLALSYAIAGDRDASEATLLPLLQAQDLAAYRTRAFALAIGGRAEEAVSIAETMLPARIAQRLAPYLRYMPRLTRAQQAAAANFGTFPHPEAIGRDDPAIAAYAAGEPPPPLAAGGADARLIPGGAPLGTASAAQSPPSAAAPPASAPPATSAPLVTLPSRAEQAASVDAALAAAARERLPADPPAAPPAPDPAPAQTQVRVDLAEAFADFELPDEQRRTPVSADAVDITRIEPARDEPPVLRLPVNPSRHWVQVATGQDVARFRYDWRRITGAAGGLLEGHQAYYAAWGANSRLVTGPFPTENEAQALVSRLAAGGVPSFVFTSASGERVIPLP